VSRLLQELRYFRSIRGFRIPPMDVAANKNPHQKLELPETLGN